MTLTHETKFSIGDNTNYGEVACVVCRHAIMKDVKDIIVLYGFERVGEIELEWHQENEVSNQL